MYGHSDRDLSLNKSIRMWNNIPVDGRLVTGSLNELDDRINFPYVGMIFYSEFEDKYYKVLSIEDGYRVGRTGKIVRKDDIPYPNPMDLVPGYFVGNYEEYVNGGSGSIERAYIDNNGDLHIIYVDGRDENIGHVKGQDGRDGAQGQTGDTGNGIEYIDLFDQIPYGNVYRAHYTNGDHYDYTVNDGSPVEMRLNPENKDIEWKLVTEEIWNRIINADELKGPKGEDGADGQDGSDGTDGIGIQSISKTSTEGLVDTYTITFTDGTTTTFTVTNGADGQDGAQGEQGPAGQDGSDGEDGSPVQIRLNDTTKDIEWKLVSESENDWHLIINANDLKGPAGQDGTDGQDGSDGVGISGIAKTSTEGLVDTYTITLTNGETATFTVTNGTDGHDGQDGQDGAQGETGLGIKSVAVTTISEEPNHLLITYTDDTTVDAGVINVSGAEQTIDADLHELIFGDGNDWAEGSSAYYDVLQNTPSSPSVPEREEYRLSIKENDNNKNKQFMITNQIVDGKSLETLDSESQTYNSRKVRQYDSDYYKFIMKDTAKCILGGESEINIDNDTMVRLHGGVVEIDDLYGTYNPWVVVRGRTAIDIEGCYAYDTTKYHGEYEYSGTYFAVEATYFNTTPTLADMLDSEHLLGMYSKQHYTTYTQSTTESWAYFQTAEEAIAKYNEINDSEAYDIVMGEIKKEARSISKQDGTTGTKYVQCYVFTLTSKVGEKRYARKTYARQYPMGTWTGGIPSYLNPEAPYNEMEPDSRLMVRDNALVEFREGAAIKMAGSSYINASDNARMELKDGGFLGAEGNGYGYFRDKSSLYMDDFNSINMASGGGSTVFYDYTSKESTIPTTIESDGSTFNIGPTAMSGVEMSSWPRLNYRYIDWLYNYDYHWQKSVTDVSGSTTRYTFLRKAAHPSTGMPLIKRFDVTKTFTLDEIKLGFKDMGFDYIVDSTKKLTINRNDCMRGNSVCDPAYTDAIIAKLEADGYPLKGKTDTGKVIYEPAVTLIPKKGKIKEAHDFAGSYYFDSQFGWVDPSYYDRITSRTGWDELFDKVVIASFAWEHTSMAYKKYRYDVSWGTLIYLTPVVNTIDTQHGVNYWKILDNLAAKYPSSYSGLSTEDGVTTGEQCFSRLTESEIPVLSNKDPLEVFFDEENPDEYRANYLLEGLLYEKSFPTVHLENDVIFNIGAKNYRTFLQMTGKEGESTSTYIMNNSFIHHSGNSHEEMHDGSMLIMRSPTFEAAYKSYKMPWTDYTGPDINQKYFSSPIQIHDNGPLINMYDKATFHMSGTWITDEDEVDFWTKASEYVWLDNQWQYIHHDYIQFTTSTEADPTEGLDQQAINDLNTQLAADGEGCVYSSGGTVTVISHPVSGGYTLKITGFKVKYTGPDGWSRYATKLPGNPVLELTQDADVRVREKAKIFMHDQPEVNIDGKARVRLHDYATFEMDAGGNTDAKYPGHDQSEGYQQTCFRMHGKTKISISDEIYPELKQYYYLYILQSDIDHQPTKEELIAHEKSKIIRVYSSKPNYLDTKAYMKNEGHPSSSFFDDPTFKFENESPGYGNVTSQYSFMTGLLPNIEQDSRCAYYAYDGDGNPKSVFKYEDVYVIVCSITKKNAKLFDAYAIYYPGSGEPSNEWYNYQSYITMTSRSNLTMQEASMIKMGGTSSLIIEGNSNAKLSNRSLLIMEDAPTVRFGDNSVMSLEGGGTIKMPAKDNLGHSYSIYPCLDMSADYFHFGKMKGGLYNSFNGGAFDRTVDDEPFNSPYANTRYQYYGLRNMSSNTYFTEGQARKNVEGYGLNPICYFETQILTGNVFIGPSSMSTAYVTNYIKGKEEYEEYRALLPIKGQIYNAYKALTDIDPDYANYYDAGKNYITYDHIQDVKDVLSNWSTYFYETYKFFECYAYGGYYQPNVNASYYDITPVGTKIKELAGSSFKTWIQNMTVFTALQPSIKYTNPSDLNIYKYLLTTYYFSNQPQELSIDGTTQMLSSGCYYYSNQSQWGQYYRFIQSSYTNENKYKNLIMSESIPYLYYFYDYDENLGYKKNTTNVQNYLTEHPVPNDVTPSIQLKGAARFNMLGYNDSIQIFDMHGSNGEKTEVYFHNNAFVQFAQNSHTEMWDDSRFIMRAGSNRGYRNIPALAKQYEPYEWAAPVPKIEGNPIIGVYDGSGLQMTGKITETDDATKNKNFTFTSTTTTDPSTDLDQQAMNDLTAYALTQRYNKLNNVTYVSHTGESGNYTITVQAATCYYMGPEGWNRHLIKEEDSPLFELSENAQLTLFQDFSIKADNDGIEFSDGTDTVHFTISELIQLKNSLH